MTFSFTDPIDLNANSMRIEIEGVVPITGNTNYKLATPSSGW
jgi:hypothetical protein